MSAPADPVVSFANVSFRYPDADFDVFAEFSLDLPRGVISLVGQNGAGKSTLLLLASGRILPDSGEVKLAGVDTSSIEDEDQRNRLASYIYQNMEFETEESIGEVMRFVYEHGYHEKRDSAFVDEITDVFELRPVLKRPLHKLSKGELQRAIIVFSLLYGSKTIVMDEPVFALEDHQKKRAIGYLLEYSRINDVPVYYSLHELELSREYADFVLLFYRDGKVELGEPDEILAREKLEAAYEIPQPMLYQKEHLFRENLIRVQQAFDAPRNE